MMLLALLVLAIIVSIVWYWKLTEFYKNGTAYPHFLDPLFSG